MNGKEFIDSKWVAEGGKPENQQLIKEKFGKWSTRVSNTGLLNKAKQLYQFFLSSDITAVQKTLVAGALLYIISPFDIIPDFIPVAGWLDDLGIAGFALNYIFSQMNKLEATEMEKASNTKLLSQEIDGTESEKQCFTPPPFELKCSHNTKGLDAKLGELADIANVLEINGATEYLSNIEERSAAEHIVNLAIVGRYSTGKSTLINALLGKELLPTSPRPTTKAITYLIKGTKDSVYLEYADNSIEMLDSISNLETICNRTSTPVRRMTIAQADFPFDGLAITDTPGLEEPNQNISQLTLEIIPETDAFIVLLDANYLESKVEFDFISSLLQDDKERKLFVVINKTDGKMPSEVDELKKRCQVLLNSYRIDHARLYAISARNATTDVGFKQFKQDLFNYLLQDIQGEAKRHIESQVQSYADFMLASCTSALNNAAHKERMSRKETQRLHDELDRIQLEYSKQKATLQKRIAAYRAQFRLDFNDFMESLKGTVRQKILASKLETLKNTDEIAVKIKQEIVAFIDKQMSGINEKINADISQSQSEIRNNLAQINLDLDIKVKDYSSFSHLFLPVVVAAGYLTWGFFSFSFIGLVLAAVVGRSFFEKSIESFLGKFGVSRVREKLIEATMPQIDDAKKQLEAKLDESFDIMEKEILSSYDTACANASMPLRMSLPSSTITVEQVKECRDRLITLKK